MNIDVYQMVTDRICQLMEQGFIPWVMPWAMKKTSAWSGIDGHTYSLLNQFMLADPGKKYKDFDELIADIAGEWVTFNQAHERGGKVAKGAKGRKVVFFRMVNKKDENGEKTDEVFPVITWSVVFKVSDCEGIEQKFHTDADCLYDFNPNENAEIIAFDYVNRENIKWIHKHGNKAAYNPETDTVTMPLPEQFKDNAEYYSTLFHELIHSTGHPNRLNRLNKAASFGEHDYSVEELTAEIGSASILATLGIENASTFRNSTAYIQNWLKALKNDKKMIVAAASRAEKAMKMILNIKGVETA